LRPLQQNPVTQHPDLIVGLDYADDGAVYMLPSGDVMVQTVDFFTPIVDEPYDWGRIAAANALSDVYAMGGYPITALQLVGWPRDVIGFDVLGEVIEGGAAVLVEAGCTLVGGHSVDDAEPKYGFAVTGLIEPGNLVTNAGARPGDKLVLTKPLGTGIAATGIKSGAASKELRNQAVKVMASLNDGAARAMASVDVHAATDITGYGFLGHLRELLESAQVTARIDVASVPILDGVQDLLAGGAWPGGSQRNLDSVLEIVDTTAVDSEWPQLLADAQTSGGLLISVPSNSVDDLVSALKKEKTLSAAVVGEITQGPPEIILE